MYPYRLFFFSLWRSGGVGKRTTSRASLAFCCVFNKHRYTFCACVMMQYTVVITIRFLVAIEGKKKKKARYSGLYTQMNGMLG